MLTGTPRSHKIRYRIALSSICTITPNETRGYWRNPLDNNLYNLRFTIQAGHVGAGQSVRSERQSIPEHVCLTPNSLVSPGSWICTARLSWQRISAGVCLLGPSQSRFGLLSRESQAPNGMWRDKQA